MNRIHGENKIVRSKNIKIQKKYEQYRENLRKDFFYICGYCGKFEQVTKHGFEIDHFVPLKVDPSKEILYSNLVYSCFTCNRKKSADWPTKDTNLSHNGIVGYVDPAIPEFDDHLEKNENGEIIPKTPVGAYMVKKFKFNKRPMKTIHKLNLLLQKKKLLKMKMKVIKDPLTLKNFYEIQNEIDYLMNIIFSSRE